MTNDEGLDLLWLSAYPYNWIKEHCQIIDKAGNMVWLDYNDSQIHTDLVIEEIEDKGMPVRIVHLKARQMGETTRGCARLYRNTCIYPNRRALITAHKDKSCETIFRKVKIFQANNPEALQHEYSNKKELIFSEPHWSSIEVQTMAGKDLGRSETYHYIHISELAFIDNPDEVMLGVKQCVPKIFGTMVIVESTPRGMGGHFYRLYVNSRTPDLDKDKNYMVMPQPSEDNWNGYYRIFHPWFMDKTYRLSPPDDFEKTEDEIALAEMYNLDDSQIYWRRRTIVENCDNDIDSFLQEYPSDDVACFVVSGRPVFPVDKIKRMMQRCKDPIKTGHFDDAGEFVEEYPRWIEIWEEPVHNELYAIGADTAEGLDPEESNDPDANSAHVEHCLTGRQICKICGQMDPAIFAQQLDHLGRWYNDAYLGVEVNNSSGGATRQALKDLNYPNLHWREVYDEIADKMTFKLGFETNKQTRMMILTGGEGLGSAIRNGKIHIFSVATLHQFVSFVYNKDGKPTAQTGEHDDDVMSSAITHWMAGIASQVGTSDIPDTTGDIEEDEFKGRMVIGGVDNSYEGYMTKDDDEQEYV